MAGRFGNLALKPAPRTAQARSTLESRARSLVPRLAAAGVIGGIAVALATVRILATALYEVEPADAPTLVATAVLLTATSLIAVWIPARRAARPDPVLFLRDA